MTDSQAVLEARSRRHAAVAADAEGAKANSGHAVSSVRRAARDAYAELAEANTVDEVAAVELPSERLGDPDDGDDEDDGDEESGDEEPDGDEDEE